MNMIMNVLLFEQDNSYTIDDFVIYNEFDVEVEAEFLTNDVSYIANIKSPKEPGCYLYKLVDKKTKEFIIPLPLYIINIPDSINYVASLGRYVVPRFSIENPYIAYDPDKILHTNPRPRIAHLVLTLIIPETGKRASDGIKLNEPIYFNDVNLFYYEDSYMYESDYTDKSAIFTFLQLTLTDDTSIKPEYIDFAVVNYDYRSNEILYRERLPLVGG